MDICGTLDEGLADRIDAVFESKSKTLSIVLGECSDAQVNVRKVQPLSGSQFAPDSTTQTTSLPRTATTSS